MVFKVSGRVTDVSFLQSLKAPSPILVTPEGSAIFDTCYSIVFHFIIDKQLVLHQLALKNLLKDRKFLRLSNTGRGDEDERQQQKKPFFYTKYLPVLPVNLAYGAAITALYRQT